MKKLLPLIIITCFLIDIYSVNADVMSSQNYRIQSDSINIGGFDEQSSANYKMKDTIGEIASDESASSSYKLKAGYRQMAEEAVYITISSPANVNMSAAINGITGNPGSPRTGSATWTVATNNYTGFNMKLHASTDPAMQLDGSNQFADYTPAVGGTPDYDWSSPAASAAEFGFTVEPETDGDTVQLFLDNSGASPCNTAGGTQTDDKCWFDFNGLNDINVINRTIFTNSGGEDEVVKFQTESNAKYLKEGNYVATITATAVTN